MEDTESIDCGLNFLRQITIDHERSLYKSTINNMEIGSMFDCLTGRIFPAIDGQCTHKETVLKDHQLEFVKLENYEDFSKSVLLRFKLGAEGMGLETGFKKDLKQKDSSTWEMMLYTYKSKEETVVGNPKFTDRPAGASHYVSNIIRGGELAIIGCSQLQARKKSRSLSLELGGGNVNAQGTVTGSVTRRLQLNNKEDNFWIHSTFGTSCLPSNVDDIEEFINTQSTVLQKNQTPIKVVLEPILPAKNTLFERESKEIFDNFRENIISLADCCKEAKSVVPRLNGTYKHALSVVEQIYHTTGPLDLKSIADDCKTHLDEFPKKRKTEHAKAKFAEVRKILFP